MVEEREGEGCRSLGFFRAVVEASNVWGGHPKEKVVLISFNHMISY